MCTFPAPTQTFGCWIGSRILSSGEPLQITWCHFKLALEFTQCKGIRTGSHGVPSPTHVSKSQHGGRVPTCKPQGTTKIWLNIIKVGSWSFYAKIFVGLGLRVGSSFLLDPTCNASPKPRLQKVLPCRHPCHSWGLRLGTLCEVVSPNFHALNSWDCTDWPQVTWDLELGTRVNRP
jgi:hypothetical protein